MAVIDKPWNDTTGSTSLIKRFKTRKGAQNLADRQNSGLAGEVFEYRGIKHSSYVTVVEDTDGTFVAVWVNAPFTERPLPGTPDASETVEVVWSERPGSATRENTVTLTEGYTTRADIPRILATARGLDASQIQVLRINGERPAQFTVVSDVDEVRESHHATLADALRDGVWPLLETYPLAEVVVLDAAGQPVYDVAKHDSCTRHLIAFSKEINCPRCSAERPCEGCGAVAGEPCDPFCTGAAAAQDAADEAAPVTVHVATAEVRGYTVTAVGKDEAEARAVLLRTLKGNDVAREIKDALYGTWDAWLEDVSTYTLTTGTAAWL